MDDKGIVVMAMVAMEATVCYGGKVHVQNCEIDCVRISVLMKSSRYTVPNIAVVVYNILSHNIIECWYYIPTSRQCRENQYDVSTPLYTYQKINLAVFIHNIIVYSKYHGHLDNRRLRCSD